jgi:putative transport protein
MELFFSENPLVLLFVVAAIGYLVGKINFMGVSLGVAAILFVGLAFGAMFPAADIPEILFKLGLVIFVYSIGIGSGTAFFKSIKANGSRDIVFGIVMLTISAALAVAIHYFFSFDASTTTGIYTGSTTNTPALAAVIEQINQLKNVGSPSSLSERAVVAYSFTYPMGVMGSIIAILLLERVFRIDYAAEKSSLKNTYPVDQDLTSATVEITNLESTEISMRDLFSKYKWNVIFGRFGRSDGQIELPNWDTKFFMGDQVMVVGTTEEIKQVAAVLGKRVDSKLSYDRSEYDVRRIFVSNPRIVGKSLAELNLDRKYNTVVTRIRRGDVDMLAKGNTVLELGDRVRFVARRNDLAELSKYFGDSYYESSRLNLFSFGLGIALGLLLGTVEFTLPGNINFKLGLAGGPIIVSLILGALQRTGPIVWSLPYSVNVTLRQLGLIILLAVIGIKSGPAFVASVTGGAGLLVFVGGVIISLFTAILTFVIGYKIIKIPFTLLLGIVANQPAILEFGLSRAKNNLPIIGYTIIFPISLVLKIVYAQLLFLILS